MIREMNAVFHCSFPLPLSLQHTDTFKSELTAGPSLRQLGILKAGRFDYAGIRGKPEIPLQK